MIGLPGPQVRCGGRSHHRVGPGFVLATRHQQAHAVHLLRLVGHQQGGGDHGQGVDVPQGAQHPHGGGRVVQHHGASLGDPGGQRLGHGLFDPRALLEAELGVGLAQAGCHRTYQAPVEVDDARLFEVRHVPVDGHGRDANGPRQVLDPDAAPGDDVLGDHLAAILRGLRDGWPSGVGVGLVRRIHLPNRVGNNPPEFRGCVKREAAIAAVPGGAGGQSVVTRREARNRAAMNHTRATTQAAMTTFEKIPT